MSTRYWRGRQGISDSVIYGCSNVALGFASHAGAGGTNGDVYRMKILDSPVGIYHFPGGTDGKRHDRTKVEFRVSDTMIYAKADGSGNGIQNPAVHAQMLGEDMSPDWWTGGGIIAPMGHSTVSLYFRSKISNITFVGYSPEMRGVAMTVGFGRSTGTSDEDFAPMVLSNIKYVQTPPEAYVRFSHSSGAASHTGDIFEGIKTCPQIDCDGRRNALITDEDGTTLGAPGTIIPEPQKFYTKLTYNDPMGFENMEDLIPMPARYDRVGNAIPFPSNEAGDVTHGSGGGLEYECNVAQGCEPVSQQAGKWVPNSNLKLAKGNKIVAIREAGGLARMDPIHHGWAYASYWVKTDQCKKRRTLQMC